MTATPQAARPRRLLLILSVCLNFLLAGVLLGGAWIAWQRAALGDGGPNQPFTPRVLVELLPPDGAAKVRAIARGEGREILALRREARRARLQAFRALQAEPFDRAAFAAALDRIRSADAAVLSRGQDIMVEIVSALTPEERRLVAEGIRKRGWQRRMEREAGRQEDDGPPAP